MKKYDYAKKRLTLEAGLCGAVVLAIVIASFVMSGMVEERTSSLKRIKRTTVKEQDRAKEFEEQIQISGISSQIYDELSFKKAAMDFVIDRNILRERLGILKERFRMSHMSVEASPQSLYENKELEALGVEANQSLVELNLGAMSDVHVFSFMKALEYELPGLVRPVSFHLNRDLEVNNQNLLQMKSGKTPQMVSGSLQFIWYGFEAKPQESDAQ